MRPMHDPTERDTPVPKPPVLGNRPEDRWASVLKAGTGMVPVVGSLLSEIVSNLIPNQRIDRIEGYLRYLAEELAQRGIEGGAASLQLPENVALLEDGGFQAARATSDERLRFIARAVAEGLSDHERAGIHSRRILRLLGEVDDEELVILEAYENRDTEKFQKLMPAPLVLGADRELREANALYTAAIGRLEQLQLLEFRHDFDREEEKPKYDVMGKPRGSHQVTGIGRMLLEAIGLDHTRPPADRAPLW